MYRKRVLRTRLQRVCLIQDSQQYFHAWKFTLGGDSTCETCSQQRGKLVCFVLLAERQAPEVPSCWVAGTRQTDVALRRPPPRPRTCHIQALRLMVLESE